VAKSNGAHSSLELAPLIEQVQWRSCRRTSSSSSKAGEVFVGTEHCSLCTTVHLSPDVTLVFPRWSWQFPWGSIDAYLEIMSAPLWPCPMWPPP